jgi:hypothetical protein
MMSKTEDFILSEKKYYGKLYSDIAFAIDEIQDFLDKDIVKNRKYVSRQPLLKKYIDLLDAAKSEDKSKGFFGSLFGGDKYTGILKDFKKDHHQEFNQLEKCTKCECLKCIAICKFDSCNGCRNGERIGFCDHEKTNLAFFDGSEDSIIELVNNKTGQDDRYEIMAIIQDPINDKRYIVIENAHDRERFILYLYPRISQDEYGEITDETDFNFAASAYENVERT